MTSSAAASPPAPAASPAPSQVSARAAIPAAPSLNGALAKEIPRPPVPSPPAPEETPKPIDAPPAAPSRSRARLVRRITPHYPEAARREGQEGLVRLRMEIGADGRVKTAEIIASSGFPLLDAAALAAVKTWRYEPAQENGHPVAEERRVAVQFRLEDR
ncbi:MAG TPA: energy transducer TonB [Firmicutes bacterium]|nr:energy transducer TonB [Bacillota bacterium]